MRGIDSKDQVIALLGLLIILFVAGGIFLAHPQSKTDQGEVAGVQLTNSIFPVIHSTHYQAGYLANQTQQMIDRVSEMAKISAQELQRTVKKNQQ